MYFDPIDEMVQCFPQTKFRIRFKMQASKRENILIEVLNVKAADNTLF